MEEDQIPTREENQPEILTKTEENEPRRTPSVHGHISHTKEIRN